MQVSLDSKLLHGLVDLSTTVSPWGNRAPGVLTAVLPDCLSFSCHFPRAIQDSLLAGSSDTLSLSPESLPQDLTSLFEKWRIWIRLSFRCLWIHLSFRRVCAHTRAHEHLHTHTTVGDRIWISLLQTWSLLRLVSVS